MALCFQTSLPLPKCRGRALQPPPPNTTASCHHMGDVTYSHTHHKMPTITSLDTDLMQVTHARFSEPKLNVLPVHLPPFLSYPAPRPQLLPRSSPARAAGPTRPPHFLQLSLAFALCFQALLLKILFSLELSPLLFRLFQKEQISLLSSLVTHLPLLLGTSSSKKEKKNIFFLPKIFPPFRITF